MEANRGAGPHFEDDRMQRYPINFEPTNLEKRCSTCSRNSSVPPRTDARHTCLWFAALLACIVPQAAQADLKVSNDGSTPATASQQETWAHITIKGQYPEGAQLPGLFGNVSESLSTSISRLDQAADDKSITGVVLKIEEATIGWAKQNEFRQAIARVRAKGKKVSAWLDSATSVNYLLAASCDEIVMPESGVLMLLGLRAEVSFFKNLFEMLSIRPDMLRVGKFKSAAEPYTRTEMSPEFRQEMETVLDDYFQQLVEVIAEGRQLEEINVIAAIDSGPHTAGTAKQLGLIDRIAYDDELEDVIKRGNQDLEVKIVRRYKKKKLDTDFSGFTGLVKMMNLMMGVPPAKRRSYLPKIAIIHASGMIMPGKSNSGTLVGRFLGSETLIKAIRKADEDVKVRAIILRVNSPGGSALASDLIWRAVEKVDKPVVVSMGDYAASGGYYISMGADTIFAEPGTLTGSIGVVGGKLALKGLFEKVGITTSVISRGRNSGAVSMLEGFSDSERAAMVKLFHETYGQFTQKAAQGRKMELDRIKELAGGRVYTGRMALEVGLIDKLGTLQDAIAHARQLAGLKPDEKVDQLILPKPTSPLEQLFGPVDQAARGQSTGGGLLLDSLRSFSPEVAEQLKAVGLVNILARESRLLLMPFQITVK
jgi:protease-4